MIQRCLLAIVKMLFVTIILVSVTSANSYWAKSFCGKLYDSGCDVKFTENGDVVVLGTTKSFGAGGSDFWLLYLDKEGNIKWQKTIGSSTDDYGKSIATLPDGHIVVVGSTYLDYHYAWITNMRSDGILKWDKIIKHTKDKTSLSGSPSKKIAVLSNGDFVVGICKEFPGSSYTSHIVYIDKNGNGKWSRTVCGVCIKAVSSTNDDDIVIVGKTSSRVGFGGGDVYIGLLDKNGNVLWQKIMGASAYDEANSVVVTSDDKIIVSGYTESFGKGRGDAWLIELDLKGNIVWQKAIGGDGSDGSTDVDVMPNGDIIFVGGWKSFKDDGGYAWIVKLDSNGDNIIAQKTYYFGEFKSVDISRSGDIICGGSYKSCMLVMKLNSNLEISNCTILRDTEASIEDTNANVKEIDLEFTAHKTPQLEDGYPAVKESNAHVLDLCKGINIVATTTRPIKTLIETTTAVKTSEVTQTPSVTTTRKIPSSFEGLLTLLLIIGTSIFMLRKNNN